MFYVQYIKWKSIVLGFKRTHSQDFLNTEGDNSERPGSPSLLFPPKTRKSTESKNIKEETPGTTICSLCKLHDAAGEDKRNDMFSLLLREELKFIEPCMRSRIFGKIIFFLHQAKGHHTDDIELTDTEKNEKY